MYAPPRLRRYRSTMARFNAINSTSEQDHSRSGTPPPVWWHFEHVLYLPYEEGRREAWHEIKRLCAEVVQVLTGPARGNDASVVDSYRPSAKR
ncbi:hypothetical protein ANCDUO_11533 [Ancylostoma duodenale]|uniref:Uncharacterized protein n=1 Tax=Ancylostoma duodenale TaxID=51022 RepID=A0A0C2D7W3_9BILA|nr:hypothetical protein ANCDUO_11533 [Ancylostoma duodenale]